MILAHGGNLAAGLLIFAAILVALIGLPTLIGMAITVARRSPEGRWQPVAIGAIVSVVIAAVAGTAFEVHVAALSSLGIGGGALLGAGIGGLVRLIRKR